MTYDPFWGTSSPISGYGASDPYNFFDPASYTDAGFTPGGGSYFYSDPTLNDSYWMPDTPSWSTNISTAAKNLYTDLGGLRGVTSLGLGGLSLLGNYLAKKDAEEMAKDQFDHTLGFKEKELATTSNTDLAKVDAMMNLLSQRGRVELDPRRYAEILASGQIPADMMATQQRIDVGQKNYAHGGAHYGKGRQGALGLLRGGSPGQMDDVNAALSHGEYVVDADVVAALGDGNTEAGAQRLDEMREAIRKHKRSAPVDDIPPPARHPLAYLKGVK